MIPRVYKNQHLGGANGFVINGPTGNWDGKDLAAVVTFVIKQNGSGPVSIGIGKSVVYDRPAGGASIVWTAPVRHVSGPAFHAGDADVQAWISIAETGGASEMYPWNVPITLS